MAVVATAALLGAGTLIAQDATPPAPQPEDAGQVAAAAPETDSSVAAAFDFFGASSPSSLDQLREMETRFHELAEKVAKATVNVQVGGNQGSGVIVTRDGYVMTAAHVIGGADRDAIITLEDGTQLAGKTLGLNRTIDSGLLKITEKGKFTYLMPGESANLKTGQWVMAIGHPGGWDPVRKLVYRVGRVLAVNESIVRTDCSLVGGDSGGPLVDMDGNVIGIHSRIGASLNSNVHVPVDVFTTEWDDLIQGRDWGRGIGGENPANTPWIGLSFRGETLEIESVRENGPAAKAGIQVGDVVLEFNDTRVTSFRRFGAVFDDLEPGDKVQIKVKRGEEELEMEMTVGSRADDR
jgi:serine protease Do